MTKPYYQDERITIYHGDSREILPTLDRARLIATDPPYGVGLYYSEDCTDSKDGYWDWFLPFIDIMREAAGTVVFTHRNFSLKYVTGWDWVGVWNKPAAFGVHIGYSPILPHWEPIYFFGIHKVGTSKYVSDVFTYNPVAVRHSTRAKPFNSTGRAEWQKSDKFGVHPAPKPIGLYEAIIDAFTDPDDLVIDPFLGTGTTCLAAKKLGRNSIGIEVNERYCKLAAERCSQGVLALSL